MKAEVDVEIELEPREVHRWLTPKEPFLIDHPKDTDEERRNEEKYKVEEAHTSLGLYFPAVYVCNTKHFMSK